MKKTLFFFIAFLLTANAHSQTFQFTNEPGQPEFFVTVSPSLVFETKGDSIFFSSIQQDICGPESACQGDLVTSPNPACPGQWVTVTANPTQGAWPYTFLWSNGATTQQQVLQFWSQSDLWVQVTDATGCSWFAQGTIFMAQNISPTISGNPNFCSGSSTTLTASGGSQVQWTGPNGFTSTNATINVSQPGIYTVTVSNGGGCSGSASVNVMMSQAATISIAGPNGFCPNSSASLSATSNTPNTTYTWTGPNGFVANGASITVSQPGTYTATGTAPGGCSSSATKAIVAYPAPSAKIKVSYSNNIATLSVLPGLNALWSTGANTSSITNVPNGTYAVTVTDQQTGCVATSTPVELDLAPCVPPCPLPVASFTFTVNGPLVTFTNTSSNATSYMWAFGDNTTSMQASPTHAYQPGNYTVTLTATNACGSHSVTQTLSIACPPPVANFTFVTNGATATFASTSTGNGLSYLWNFGDNTTTTLQNPTHTYATAGNYTVTLKVTNACGAVNQVSKIVTVVFCIQPDAQFNLPQSGGLILQFTNTSTGTGPLTYAWTFGDGGTSNDEDPTHEYAQSGVYLVKLKITDACGNQDQIVKTLTVLNAVDPVGDRDFLVYPTVTTSQFFLEGSAGWYIVTDSQGRSKKLFKSE